MKELNFLLLRNSINLCFLCSTSRCIHPHSQQPTPHVHIPSKWLNIKHKKIKENLKVYYEGWKCHLFCINKNITIHTHKIYSFPSSSSNTASSLSSSGYVSHSTRSQEQRAITTEQYRADTAT